MRGELEPGAVEDRRQEQQEDDVGIELDVRQARDEAEREPRQHEHHVLGQADGRSDPGDRGDGEEQRRDRLDLAHRTSKLGSLS